MGISSHEMYLILKVRDEASRALRAFGNEFANLDAKAASAAQKQIAAGAALATVGVGIAGVGIAGVQWMNGATDAAMAYNQQAASTVTQLDQVRLSMQQVKDMGLEVARTMPVAFEEIQPALYDIFSSIDVSAPQAAMLLRNIGKAAVGGSVDMQTAGRATIAVLNAYKMPAEDVTRVNDVMFQLVRKGVGTYEQFTSVIGRSIPSAIRAGQSFETLAGMMAFMTRNGMSTAQATTSAARALDALSNPKTVARFKEWGVPLTDAKGQFRDVTDIIADMRVKLENLSPAARSAKLAELFKGSGGTIQAMRFFNLALSDSNNLLPELVGHMNNAEGAADAAYKVMANTPQAQLQQMTNQYQAMKVMVGDQLLPVKLRLIQALSALLGWWNQLSPATQRVIITIAAVTSAILVLTGIVVAIAGVILMFMGAITLAGVSLGAIVAPILLVGALLATLAFGVYYVINNWKEMGREISVAWNWIKTTTSTAVAAVVGWVTTAWNAIRSWTTSIWSAIAGFFASIWARITGAANTGMNMVRAVIAAISGVILGAWRVFWGIFGNLIVATWNFIKAAVNLGITAIRVLIHIGMTYIRGVWTTAWNNIRALAQTVWTFIRNFIGGQIAGVRAIITSVMNAIRAVWNAIWGAIGSYVIAAWNRIRSAVSSATSAIRSIISAAWNYVRSSTVSLWNGTVSAVTSGVTRAYNAAVALRSRIVSFFASAGTWLWNAGVQLVQGLANGIASRINAATAKMQELAAKLKSFLPGSPVKTGPLRSWNNGGAGKRLVDLIATGLRRTGPLDQAMNTIARKVNRGMVVTAGVDTTPVVPFGPRPGDPGYGSAGGGDRIIEQHFTINTQEIDPRKHAADLGWELAVRT